MYLGKAITLSILLSATMGAIANPNPLNKRECKSNTDCGYIQSTPWQNTTDVSSVCKEGKCVYGHGGVDL